MFIACLSFAYFDKAKSKATSKKKRSAISKALKGCSTAADVNQQKCLT
jgi:hypothetical protein